jgi:hypothetical protein
LITSLKPFGLLAVADLRLLALYRCIGGISEKEKQWSNRHIAAKALTPKLVVCANTGCSFVSKVQ